MEKEKEVKKHAAAIHCSNSLSLLQRKISNVLLYYAYKELAEKEEHVISVSQLCKILGITTHNYDALKQALKALVQTVLEWNVVDDNTGEEDWSATTVLASVRLKGGSCHYSYSVRMRDLLYSPSVYGKINLVIQSRFKSSYALALYENSVRYKSIGGTKWFDILEFRKLMGMADSQYLIFRDLKRRVIDKAIEEVNTYADILVVAEYKRVGRKVIAIKFFVKERQKKPRLNQGIPEEARTKKAELENNIIYHQLVKDFGIKNSAVTTILSDYDVEYIQDKIQLILTSESFKSGKIHDLAGYLLAALRDDYQKPVSSELIQDKTNSEELQLKQAKQDEQQAIQEKRKEYSKYAQQIFIQQMSSLGDNLEQELCSTWLKNLEALPSFMGKRIKRLYQEQGLKHPQVYVSFKEFLTQFYPKYLPTMMSFEEFAEQEVMV